MTEGRCAVTELPVDGCAHCRPAPPPPAPAADGDYGRPFRARYDGRCGDCGDGFDAGDTIAYGPGDVVVCEGCVP